jgi:hypothetical protein
MRLEAPGGVFWVRPAPLTRTIGKYPDPQGRAIYVITAHNPGGRMASDTANALAETRLVAELERRGLTWWLAAGGDPSWTHVEPSAAVIGMDEGDAVALGAEFGQDAIFVLTPTNRRVIGCADGRVTATGWSIEPDADLSEAANKHDARVEPVTVPAGEDEEADEPHYMVPAVEVTVHTENLQVGGDSVAPKEYDDYINWTGRREGLLCTLQRDEGATTLHGDGQGGVVIGGAWNGPQGPFPVTAALQQLADVGVFKSVAGFVSGTWGPGDVATLMAPFTNYSEFVVDGDEWSTNGEWADPVFPHRIGGLVLAESVWEREEDGMSSPGSGESGAEVLLRIGPRYVIYSINGSEQEREDLDAVDDEAAVAAFRTAIGAS